MLSKISSRIKNKLLSLIGYWDNGLLVFIREGEDFTLKPYVASLHSKPLLIIVSRRHIYETNQILPVSSFNEARRLAVNIKPDTPFAGDVRHILTHHQNKWIYNGCVLDKSYQKLDFSPLFLLPITTILNVQKGRVLSFNNKYLFIENDAGVLNTVESLDQTNNTLSVQAWLHTTGLNTEKLHFLSQAESINTLIGSLKKITPLQWLNAFVSRKTAFNQEFWKKAGVSVVAISSCYMILTSMVLFAYESYLDLRLANMNTNIESALVARSAYQSALGKAEVKQESLIQDSHVINFWEGLLLVRGLEGVNIDRMNVTPEKIEIYGQAKRASDVLLALSNTPTIVEPKFTSPVRTNFGVEVFAISWGVVK